MFDFARIKKFGSQGLDFSSNKFLIIVQGVAHLRKRLSDDARTSRERNWTNFTLGNSLVATRERDLAHDWPKLPLKKSEPKI